MQLTQDRLKEAKHKRGRLEAQPGDPRLDAAPRLSVAHPSQQQRSVRSGQPLASALTAAGTTRDLVLWLRQLSLAFQFSPCSAAGFFEGWPKAGFSHTVANRKFLFSGSSGAGGPKSLTPSQK